MHGKLTFRANVTAATSIRWRLTVKMHLISIENSCLRRDIKESASQALSKDVSLLGSGESHSSSDASTRVVVDQSCLSGKVSHWIPSFKLRCFFQVIHGWPSECPMRGCVYLLAPPRVLCKLFCPGCPNSR